MEQNLPKAMAAAFAEIDSASKSSTNPHFRSKYADLTAVIGAIKPALAQHGLFFTQQTEPHESGVQVETVLHHESGETLSLGKLFVPANKKDAQGFGSALTYARRYALVTAFGVPVEDDDGEAARKSKPDNSATQAQVTKIIALCDTLGGDTVQQLCEAKGVSAVPELTKDAADGAIKTLEARLAKRAEKADA